MELIAQLIAATLEELFDRGVDGIDDEMEEFAAWCEIEYGLPVSIVTMCGFYVFLWLNVQGKWEAYHSMSIEFAQCVVCHASLPVDTLSRVEGEMLCSGCASPIRNWVEVQQEMAVLADKEVQVWH